MWVHDHKAVVSHEGQGPTKIIMVRDTPPYGHAPTYQISLTYLEKQKCYDRYLKQFFLVLPVLSGHLSSGFPYMVKTSFMLPVLRGHLCSRFHCMVKTSFILLVNIWSGENQ
jgi:hypothetical protein